MSIMSVIDFIFNCFIVIQVNFCFIYQINISYFRTSFVTQTNSTPNTITYKTSQLNEVTFKHLTSLLETSSNFRFIRFNNPLISYDYKCGHYLGIWDQLYPNLITSYLEVGRGIRKAP